MKKTIATISAVSALLLVAIPAMARTSYRMPRVTPDINLNVAMVENDVESRADTGDNRVNVYGQTEQQKPTCLFGHCFGTRPQPVAVTGVIETGDAGAEAYGYVTVGRQENGCCDEGCTSPCRSRCGRTPTMPTSEVDANLVMVDNEVDARADSGDNRLTVRGGSGYLYTGNAGSVADGTVVVNAQVNDLR